ncbi:zinc finger protein 436-like isoform X2 [Mugil cephalus]|uniref:zinc finger protein 436-like isoform X2 n=1 Tax=Mugil cephalus TaxID=48193 RepID=UPI001FB6A428|nr:zinc finger protein 436-like isoform X2 [Mugil cephalus]
MEWKTKGSPLPPASLHLLVPPLVLELCRGDGVSNLQAIQSHLDKIHSCSSELSSSDQASADILKTSYRNFAQLVQNILNIPVEKESFFQEVFPVHYGCAYNQSIQQLVSVFLSRLDQLLPVPDLQQTTDWLVETSASEDFGRHLSESFPLKTLLLHHKQLGTLSSAWPSSEEDVVLSTLALPLPSQTGAERIHAPCSEDGDYDGEEGALALGDLEEDQSQNSDVCENDELSKKQPGPRLFICPQRPFTQRTKKKVHEHIQTEHRTTAPVKKKKARRKAHQKSGALIVEKKKEECNQEKKRIRSQKDSVGKKRESKQKKENSENKEQHRAQTEPTGEDKRFLSARAVSKNFTEEETKCLTCEKVFEHPNQLKTHARLHGFRYHCSQCEKGFTSASGYYQHQRLHRRGRIFTCMQCDKGFLCRYSLKQHERLHAGPSDFCGVCGKNFSKSGFVRHMQMHRGEKNYLCTVCGKSFLSSGELLLHNRSHTGETPYTCTRCGKGFSCKSHLNVHTRSHTGERPYLCSQCPKRFLTLNCLKRHTLSHNGVKPFKCPNCEREFSQQGNLKRHMAVHKPNT